MIIPIQGSYSSFFFREIDAMFKSRAETFGDRLGWDVVVHNGYERDRFDDLDPLYLVSVDRDSGEYLGSLRLLPTTGPNMLQDVFPQLLGTDEGIADPTIWESSRICVREPVGQTERTSRGLNFALCELILGIGEIALLAGLTRIVSVFDARMLRILRAVGCDLQVIGTPTRVGDVMTYAALFDTGAALLAKVRKGLGVSDAVLASYPFERASNADGKLVGPRLQTIL